MRTRSAFFGIGILPLNPNFNIENIESGDLPIPYPCHFHSREREEKNRSVRLKVAIADSVQEKNKESEHTLQNADSYPTDKKSGFGYYR